LPKKASLGNGNILRREQFKDSVGLRAKVGYEGVYSIRWGKDAKL